MDKIITFAHKLLKEKINKESIALDLTIGRGNDALFLIDKVKYLYGFDIQDDAIESTKNKLKGYTNYQLILDNHKNVPKHVNELVKGAIFNLGYLPNGSKYITTLSNTTIESLKEVLKLLDINGIVVIVIYPGHKEGMFESIEIEKFVSKLDQKEFDVVKYEFLNQINFPPYLIAIERIRL